MTVTRTDAISVEIDPHAILPNRYLGSDEDGPHYGPVSLYDAIVNAAAQRLVKASEKQIREDISEKVDEQIGALLDARLGGMIDEALNGEITVTDEWGGTRSQGTLREQIVKYAQSQLTVSSRNSYNRDTALDNAIKEHVGYSLSKELAEAVAGAKKKLLAELTKQTSEALSKAIYDGVVRDRA